jgi:hypothetical protein
MLSIQSLWQVPDYSSVGLPGFMKLAKRDVVSNTLEW